MRTMARLAHLASAVGLAATVALLSAVPGASAPMPGGIAWIDQPLAGSTVPLAEVTVTVHATDPTGVAILHLWVGDELASTTTTNDPPILLSHDFTWTPPKPGSYVLMARGVGIAGEWGQPAIAIVTVGEDGESPSPDPSGETSPSAEPSASGGPSGAPGPSVAPVPTPRPSSPSTPRPTSVPSPAPTPTPRPTPIPCSPAAPDLLAPTDGVVIRDPADNPPTFRWAHRTPPACTPIGYRVQVFAGPDLGALVLDVTLGAVTEWTPGSALADCATYSWRVATRAPGGGFGPWSSASTFELFIGRCT
jgi:hypothetical protein